MMGDVKMDKMLLYSIKEIMIYYRVNTTDKDLYKITLELKDSIRSNSFEVLFDLIKHKIPHINVASYTSDYPMLDSNRIYWKIEGFICESLDILLKAIENREIELIYDISDMLQGIPDVEYWKTAKNMRDYWRDYVKPIKRKWKLCELDKYDPRYLFAFKGFIKRWRAKRENYGR